MSDHNTVAPGAGNPGAGNAPVSPPAAFIYKASYRYYVLFVLVLVYMVNYIDRQIFSILLQSIKRDLHLSDTELGVLSGLAFAFFYAILGIPIASLADRFNRRNIIAISITIWSVMTAVCGLAANFGWLLIARMGVGIGEAGSSPPSQSIISDYFAAKQRATAFAIFGSSVILAVFFGLTIGGYLNDAVGWRHTLMIVGLPGVLVGLLMLTVREPPRGHSDGITQPEKPAGMIRSIKHLLSIPAFRFVAFAGATQAFTGYSIQAWTPAFIERAHGLTSSEIGTGLGIAVGIGGLLGTLPGGIISDFLAKWDIRWYAWISALGMIIGTPITAYVYLADTPEIAFIAFGATCGLLNVCLGPMFTMSQGVSPIRMRASATALLYLIINLFGMGLGALCVGALSDLLSSQYGEVEGLRMALLAICISPFLSGIFFFKAAKSLHRDFATVHPGRKEKLANR